MSEQAPSLEEIGRHLIAAMRTVFGPVDAPKAMPDPPGYVAGDADTTVPAGAGPHDTPRDYLRRTTDVPTRGGYPGSDDTDNELPDPPTHPAPTTEVRIETASFATRRALDTLAGQTDPRMWALVFTDLVGRFGSDLARHEGLITDWFETALSTGTVTGAIRADPGRVTPTRAGRAGDSQPLPTVNDQPDIQSQVIADIERRRELGIARYGTALQPDNGRNADLDLYEELLDAAMYAKQRLVEKARHTTADAGPVVGDDLYLARPAVGPWPTSKGDLISVTGPDGVQREYVTDAVDVSWSLAGPVVHLRPRCEVRRDGVVTGELGRCVLPVGTHRAHLDVNGHTRWED